MHTGFQWENLREGNHFEDPGVDGRMILKLIFERLVGEVTDSIDISQDRGRWRAVVNAVMNLGVPQNAWNFLSSLERVSLSGRTLLHGVS